MGIFNRAIPKYTRNPIDNSIKVEPVTESVQEPNIEPVALVDDAFDPLFNKAVRKRLVDMHGDPFTATLSGYAELLETAIGGNRDKGGNVLPGVGILSSFGRTMDKAGDFILGGLTETVKGVTGQGMENPLYNIFTQDQDYSGQRFLTAAANSMSKMAGGTKLTEGDFKGLWSVPSLGIELMTDPSILGGGLTRVAKGTGAVADAGRILQEYDDIMAKFAIDATAPGLRPLGKKFGAKVGSYIHNLRSEQALKNAILEGKEVLKKAVIDFNGGTITEEQLNQMIQDVANRVDEFKVIADQDPIGVPLKQMADDVERATQSRIVDMYGDIMSSNADIIVHQVNARGVMGAGLAKQISSKYPEVFQEYKKLLAEYAGREQDLLGTVQLVPTADGKFVANVFGQLDYGRSGKFTDEAALERGLKMLSDQVATMSKANNKRYTIALPKGIGSGLGGGDFDTIQEGISRALANDNVELWDLTQHSSPLVSSDLEVDTPNYDNFVRNLSEYSRRVKVDRRAKGVGSTASRALDLKNRSLSDAINILDVAIPFNPENIQLLSKYSSDPAQLLKDLGSNTSLMDISKPNSVFNRQFRESHFEDMRELSDIENSFLNSLDGFPTEKYNINSRQDFVDLIQNYKNLAPDEIEDLEYDLQQLIHSKEIVGKDKVKVSQSMAKLPAKTQILVSNYIQGIHSNVIEKAVKLGLVDPKNISSDTLGEIFDKLQFQMSRYRNSGNITQDLYAALSDYSYNFKYLKDKITPIAKDYWERNRFPEFRKRYPNANTYAFDITNSLRQRLKDFKLPKGVSRSQYLSDIDKFLDEPVLEGIPSQTLRDIANSMLDDEMLDKVPVKHYGDRFVKSGYTYGNIPALDIIKEYGEYPKLVALYDKQGGVMPGNFPAKLAQQDINNLDEVSQKLVRERVKYAKKLDELMQFIKTEVDSYEKNIGSKIGGRLPIESGVKYVERDRTSKFGDVKLKPYLDVERMSSFGKTTEDTSIGYSRSINKILSRVDFDEPIDVYKLFYHKFKTTQGDVSLADLGIEITHLPKSVLEKLENRYTKRLTMPINVGAKSGTKYSFIDILRQKLSKIAPDKWSSTKFTTLMPEDVYNTYFQKILGLPYNSMAYRVDTAGIPKLLDVNSNPEEFVKALSNPETLFKSLYNPKRDVFVDPKVQYLNRLRKDLGTVKFEKVKNIVDSKKPLERVTTTVTKPDIDVLKQPVAYEEAVTSAIEKLPDESFEQVVTNQWKIYQEADLEKRAEMLNKAFPDKEPITAAELKLYEEFGQGGKSPVTRTIEEHHPVKISLYDLLSKEFRNSIVSKQDRNAVLELPKLKEIIEESVRLQGIAGDEMPNILTLLDKQKGSIVRGTDFLTDLALAKGRKIIAYKDVNDGKLVKDVLASIQSNVDAVNNAAGGEVIKVINHINEAGQHVVGYRLVGNQKLFKKLSKNLDGLRLNDIVFEPVSALTKEEADFLATYSPVVEHLANVQREASEYYRKIGFQYNDPSFFKHTFDNSKFFQDTVNNNYYKGLDIKRSEGLSDMIIDLGYFGDLRGQFGAVPNSRIFEGNISRYGDMFDTNINSITKSTFTKGVFANEKFQTTMSIFDNNEFRLNTYCKNLDDVKNILNSEANLRNLTIASVEYKDGMVYGFKKYDNFSDSSLTKALQDENAVFLPTHIFSTLDKFCKQRIRMSNKVYAFINRYLTAPFKIGVLLNPGFLLGNLNDAYLKQATTMSKKYGTSVSEELANVASSMRTTMFLNNRFSDVYDVYLKDMETYGIDIPANYKMSLQVAKSKGARDQFIKYLNGTLEGFDKSTGKKYLINPNLTEEDVGISRVWIYLNAVQPTEGITKELAGDLVENGAGKVNYAKNPVDRILYGLRYYKPSDITTHGLLNNLGTKSVFGMSEATESLARSAAILNDLKHQGIDLTEFGKILGSTADTEFNVKMINAINAMHNANFDYNASSPLLEGLEGFVPFPTFWIKNLGYWFDMFINHPQYIDAALQVNEGLWANEDTSEDEFKADAKSRGAIPLSAFNEPKRGQKLSNFFKGIYKPSPLQSMFTAFGTLNNPIETTFQRTHPLIQGATAVAGTEPMFNNLTTYLQNPEDIRYRPYNTNQYQPNIDSTEEEFNPLAYAGHKLNPFDRVMNTYLRTPGKIKRGEAQLSDFLPSVFQPDFSKK